MNSVKVKEEKWVLNRMLPDRELIGAGRKSKLRCPNQVMYVHGSAKKDDVSGGYIDLAA